MTALLLLVMLGWGLNLPIVKALTSVMDVVWVAVVRMASASLTLTAVVLLRDRGFPILTRRPDGHPNSPVCGHLKLPHLN